MYAYYGHPRHYILRRVFPNLLRRLWTLPHVVISSEIVVSDFIGDPPIIVTIWNVVFANKSRKFGWIWMKLGRWG